MENSQSEKKGVPKWAKVVLAILSVVIGILLIAFVIVYRKWQRADILTADMFQANTAGEESSAKVSEIVANPNAKVADEYEPNVTIEFEGQKYRYNDNLINILVTGIDDYGLKADTDTDVNPYQADTIVLGTVDAVKKTVSFMCIPRDTVTDIKVLDLNDEVATVRKGPIAIQHSFGTQGEKTNEAVSEAVSELLYNVPIYRYVAIDISAIPDINDSLGGIRVDIPEDLTKWDPKMKAGVTDYLLLGEDAVIFVARRDTGIDDSAMGRMMRQIAYLKKLFPALKEETSRNLMYPISMYNRESAKIKTNLSIDEMTYLAKLMLDLELEDSQIVSVPGQMKRIEPGEIEDYEYEMGYIVDEEELKKLVVDRFYVKVEQ